MVESKVERQRRQAREWKARNKEKVQAYRAEYFQAHKDSERENLKRFFAAYPVNMTDRIEFVTAIKSKLKDKLQHIEHKETLVIERDMPPMNT